MRATTLKVIQWSIGIGLPFLIVVPMVNQVGIDTIAATLAGLDISSLVIGYVLFFPLTAVRTARFRLFHRGYKPTFRRHFRISATYSCLVAVFPGGLGELSYPWLLRRLPGQSAGAGLGAVLIVRIHDTLLLFASLAWSGFSLGEERKGVDDYGTISLVALVSVGAVLVGLPWIALRIRHWISSRNYAGSFSLARSMHSFFLDTCSTLAHCRSYHATLALASIVIWMLGALSLFYFFRAINFAPNLVQVVFVMAMASLTALIPVNTIAGLGVREAGVGAALVTIGVSIAQAMCLAIALRIVSFPVHFVVLLVAYLIDARAGQSPNGTDDYRDR